MQKKEGSFSTLFVVRCDPIILGWTNWFEPLDRLLIRFGGKVYRHWYHEVVCTDYLSGHSKCLIETNGASGLAYYWLVY